MRGRFGRLGRDGVDLTTALLLHALAQPAGGRRAPTQPPVEGSGAMPTIGFRGVQPRDSNACGAYAVTAALLAFDTGFAPAGAELAVQTPHLDNATFRLSVADPAPEVNPSAPGPSAFANQLYGLTGVLAAPPGFAAVDSSPATRAQPPGAPAVRSANSGLNTPYAMVSSLLQLNGALSVTVNLTEPCEAFLTGLMGPVVDSEIALVDALAGARLVRRPALYLDPQTLEGVSGVSGAVQLALVGNALAPALSMHWLVRGADNRWYDPGNGSADNRWSVPDEIAPSLPAPDEDFGGATLGPYVWTGLWIDLIKS